MARCVGSVLLRLVRSQFIAILIHFDLSRPFNCKFSLERNYFVSDSTSARSGKIFRVCPDPLTSLASPFSRAVVCLALTASPLDPTALVLVADLPVPGWQERLGEPKFVGVPTASE